MLPDSATFSSAVERAPPNYILPFWPPSLAQILKETYIHGGQSLTLVDRASHLAQILKEILGPNPERNPHTYIHDGQSLTLVDGASHLGYILHSDLSDTDDILRIQTDMCHRANCLLSTFSATNPAVCTFCL